MSWISGNAELVFGLAAGIIVTLVAGLIGGGFLLRVERKRQKFERDENDRRERLRTMQAARVLDSELQIAEVSLAFYVMKRSTLWPDEHAYPDGAVWLELRATVATALDPVGWGMLCNGFLALHDGRVFRDDLWKSGHDDTGSLPPSVKALFEPPLADLRRAREALHPVAYPDWIRLPDASVSGASQGGEVGA